MRYLLLICGEEKALTDLDEAAMREHIDEYWAYDDALEAAGALIGGEPLQPVATAKTVSPGGVVTDGPFAEIAEVIGGYYVIDVPDQAAALAWAARVPGVVRGLNRVEVRAVERMERESEEHP
jgi:hypothetical protein